MITEVFNGWINYVLGSAVILLLYTIGSLFWDMYKYRNIIARLERIERALQKK